MPETLTLTVRTKVQPSASQVAALEETVTAFTDACNYALKAAREHGEWGRFALHRLCYYDLREQFGLSANLAYRPFAVSRNARARRPVASSTAL
jgi:putative transposase